MTDVREAPATMPTQTGPNPAGDFIWYELMTTDADGAKDFYDSVVGWDISEAAPEYGDYRMITRSDGKFAGGVLPLRPEMQEQGARPAWIGYLNVDDVDRSLRAIEHAGGTIIKDAFDIPNVGRIAVVTDPQGAAFCIMKPIPPANDPNAKSDVFEPNTEQRCGWNELSTSDPAAARRFYGEQFGWTSDNFMPMGEHGEYRFFEHNGVTIGAVAGTMDGGQPHWRYYFRVPSIANAKETAEAKGGRIGVGPMQVPGGDYIVIGFDPQGAEFALVGGQ